MMSSFFMKYFINGGSLYGVIYTIWRLSIGLRSICNTVFCRAVIEQCGRRTRFYKGVILLHPKGICVGSNCVFEEDVQLTSESSSGKLRIGNNTQISRGTAVDFTGNLIIGNGVVISPKVQVYTHDHGYDPHSLPTGHNLVIEDDVWIGYGTIILPTVGFIGRRAIIGAGTVVTKPVPAGAIIAGNPSRIIKHRE